MDFGHGFLPRIDARNYRAVERCLPRDGPGLFHEDLKLPWAILEAPWALEGGKTTIELCHDRGVSYFVDTQAWRYSDSRTFGVEKFASTPYAPNAPVSLDDRIALRAFVEADLETQASLSPDAYLLPGVVPRSQREDVRGETLTRLEIAEALLPVKSRPCIAFVGVHASSMEAAHRLIDELPLWLEGVYLQITPIHPLRDAPSKIIDCLMLARHVTQRGLRVIGGRFASIAPLALAVGLDGIDGGLGEGESFAYADKLQTYEPRLDGSRPARPITGRLYVPHLGKSVSSAEWARMLQVPALRGLLTCRLPCCAFGQLIETTPSRGREHSLHTRVAEAKLLSHFGRAGLDRTIVLLEQRQSALRVVATGLREADLDSINTEFIDNHLAVAKYFKDSLSQAA